jgi:Fibrinogen beta and gamma chains, C-terminal globular domain
VNFFSWYSEDYNFFYVESEATNYTLRTSQTAVGDAGDAINSQYVGRTLSNGMQFSSWDADNDRSAENCASSTGGGWWHNSCGSGRLLGNKFAKYDGYMWRELQSAQPDEGYDLKASLMLVTAVD